MEKTKLITIVLFTIVTCILYVVWLKKTDKNNRKHKVIFLIVGLLIEIAIGFGVEKGLETFFFEETSSVKEEDKMDIEIINNNYNYNNNDVNVNVSDTPLETTIVQNGNDYTERVSSKTNQNILNDSTKEAVSTDLQTYNYRISQTDKRTVRLMDINGANNFMYYLIDNGKLIFSGAGTCVYPLNKKFETLNLSMKITAPFKKNTTNTAKLIIICDGVEVHTVEIDKDFQEQDLAIDVSNVTSLSLRYEELGYTNISLGFMITEPILIYK